MGIKEQTLAKLKILVCDNDVRLSNRLYIWLSGLKVDVHLAHNYDNAIEIFAEKAPDIIITSAMDNSEGLTLIKSVKSFNEEAGIVFIFKDESAKLFKEVVTLNVDKFVHLPVETAILLDTLYRLAKEKTLSQEYSQKEQLLKEYKGAIDQTFIVTIHNTEGEITYVNERFCQTFAMDKQSALEGYVNPILHGSDREKRNKMLRAIQSKTVWQDRQSILVNESEEHIFDVSVVPILDAKDNIIEYLVLMNDVTTFVLEGRKAQEKQNDSKIEKLQLLRKHHQEMSRVKDSFLTVFAHELRTPLNAIINFADHLRKHIAKSEINRKEQLVIETQEIQRSGLHILQMINNMLDAIKLRDKKMHFEFQDFDIAESIEEVLHNNSILSDVDVELHLQEAIEIHSDATRFLQILEHLLSNAVKYGKSKIIITLKYIDNSFELSIEDDGEGFNTQKGVFELFNQAQQDDMTRSAKGLGIGLFVVKQICLNLDFDIKLSRSQTLSGAKVTIRENINEIILDEGR